MPSMDGLLTLSPALRLGVTYLIRPNRWTKEGKGQLEQLVRTVSKEARAVNN